MIKPLPVLDDDDIVVGVFHTYILRCVDGALYIGNTADLNDRITAHNAGEAALFTRTRRPVVLVYSEEHPTRQSAVQRERQLKRWTRAKKEALIRGDLEVLKRL
jgi:predicted GIY-YIG superfamily endonuclease